MAYSIEFAQSVRQQLQALSARQRTTILQAIEDQLSHQPLAETRQRKPLRPNPVAPWELRIGHIRVFYEVVEADENTVRVLAVGLKKGNKLFIGSQEIVL
jgi:mRNA-degrading endonuclease RelE of RelBE toxin-antitoxin system